MVRFDTVVDAKKFVNVCNSVPFDVDLMSGRYVIDGKSIMGLFSLDLSSRWSCRPIVRRPMNS